MKALLEIRRETWGLVKQYATVRNLHLGEAVDELLTQSLIRNKNSRFVEVYH